MPRTSTKKKRDILTDFSSLTGKDTARAMGVVPRTVMRWNQAGCPRNDDGTYDLPEVVEWLLEREKKSSPVSESENEAQKWLTEFRKERARLARIERHVAEGKYILAESVRRGAESAGRSVRDSFLNIPPRVATVVAAESNANTVEKILTNEIRGVLEELSRHLETATNEAEAESPDYE